MKVIVQKNFLIICYSRLSTATAVGKWKLVSTTNDTDIAMYKSKWSKKWLNQKFERKRKLKI